MDVGSLAISIMRFCWSCIYKLTSDQEDRIEQASNAVSPTGSAG
jgi:hypothetical protein